MQGFLFAGRQLYYRGGGALVRGAGSSQGLDNQPLDQRRVNFSQCLGIG
ncbi:hypothetical protein [Hymenobacter negativus]|nr:hypothetical protein [Hymenobacter negativus]